MEFFLIQFKTNVFLNRDTKLNEYRKATELLCTKANAEREIRKCRRDLEDNIKMDMKKTKRRGVDWICPAQDKVHWTPDSTGNNLKGP
jgi:hypothetical protein